MTFEESLIKKAAVHLGKLNEKGFDISTTDDPEEAKSSMDRLQKSDVTPMFSVPRNDFTKDEAIWVFLKKGGKIIGCSAARIYRLKGEAFSSFLSRTTLHQYGLVAPVFDYVAKPLDEDIAGNVIYLGELQICDESRGDFAALTAFVRLLQALAAMRWNGEFDAMFAFLRREHMKLARSYGFCTTYEGPLSWRELPSGRSNSHGVIVNRRSQFEHVWGT